MIKRIRRGRTVLIDPKVLLWRKRNKRFALLKSKLLKMFVERGLTPEQVRALLDSPLPALNGRTPRELWEPIYIQRVYEALKTQLRNDTK